MQLQATFRAVKSIVQAVSAERFASIRRVSIIAPLCLYAALAVTTGCGSGVLGTSTPAQNAAAPVASAKGPQLGYLWVDSDKTLRPILGITGASQIGKSVVPAGVYIGATASATAGVAILQDADGSFDLMTLPSGSPVSLGLTLPVGARIRLSPSATIALLYTPGATTASLVTGLPAAPAVHAITAPGAIADSAVSDTGTVSFEYAQGSSFAVGVTPLSGQPISVSIVKSTGGLSFLPGHDDLLFADAAANALTLVHAASTTPSSTLIPTAKLLQSPAAVGVSGSGHWALVVNGPPSSPGQNLVRVDLTTLTSTAVSCSCKPTIASTLADDGAFRVTDASTGPNWIVDAAPATPRSLFIPALPAPAKTSLVGAVVP